MKFESRIFLILVAGGQVMIEENRSPVFLISHHL